MLEEAVTRGCWDSDDLILDPVTDHLMRSKLRDAISGRVPSSGLTDAFDGMITSLLHHAFFGPGASKAVSSLAKSAVDSELVVIEYVQAVGELYDKFQEARFPRTTDRVTTDVVAGGVGPMLEDAVDDAIGSVPHDMDDRAFEEELPFDLAADGLIDEMSIWPFDPGMTEHAAADEFTSVLHGDITDGVASEAVSVDSSVNDLVFSVVRDALAKGMPSEDVMLDAAMDNLMWSMLHDAISGRAARESEDLADALDYMVTCLLHDALFGPEAHKTVSVLAKSADDSQLVVDDYVRAVVKLYDELKKVR